MFDQTLVDSAPANAPVLSIAAWAISFGFAFLGFFAGFILITAVGRQPMSSGASFFLAVIIAVFVFFTTLMLCYIVSDSSRLKLNTKLWFLVTLIFSVAGFSSYLIYAAARTKNWKRGAMPMGSMVEGLVVAALILYPLIYTSALPKTQLMKFLVAPAPPASTAPPAAGQQVVRRVSIAQLMAMPSVIPKTIPQVKNLPEPTSDASGIAVPGSVPQASGNGMPGLLPGVAAVPPPPPAAKAVPERIVVGGVVEAAKAIYRPAPAYPPLAKMARLQGVVRLEAVIGKNGRIQNLRVIDGNPLLIEAALDAVKQWRYEPTLLDGVPVEVATEIDVDFNLSE
ncbi:MAG TPA: energy transducer TonB [Terriglobia bacterium]|nr:energy transducer TonB [Terriglobia bacterium]